MESKAVKESLKEVLAVALPLMVSTGMFSLVLFVDRTFLLWHEPTQMGASMAAGNLFWVAACPAVGVVSMVGAMISQTIGAGKPHRVGRLLWQSVWLSVASIPFFILAGVYAEKWFEWTDQPIALRPLEAAYFRMLMWGAAGEVLQTALSGFFSGTHRTRTIMVVSVLSGLLNMVLDYLLIFGIDLSWFTGSESEPVMRWGIVGAGIASSLSFWFKAVVYAVLLSAKRYQSEYGLLAGWRVHWPVMRRLIYFGVPAGLMYLTESAGFTLIILQIGQLGDVPLQATSMAINFNMIAFIPLVGLSIAASVLVGQHLIAEGPARAGQSVLAALIVAWTYSGIWALIYLATPGGLISFYSLSPTVAGSQEALWVAEGLLSFVALYVLLDATQLVVAGSLRGAGDTWFVLLAGLVVSTVAVVVGIVGESWIVEPGVETGARLNWWWWVITFWISGLAVAMSARFLQGRWKTMRMI